LTKVTETIKEGKTFFSLAVPKKKAAAYSPNDQSTLAFTRAVLFAASNSGQEHHEHEHGFGCACGVLSRLSNVMATGDDSCQLLDSLNETKWSCCSDRGVAVGVICPLQILSFLVIPKMKMFSG
jgi:hypothetical protein